jgi:hypothetical protein
MKFNNFRKTQSFKKLFLLICFITLNISLLSINCHSHFSSSLHKTRFKLRKFQPPNDHEKKPASPVDQAKTLNLVSEKLKKIVENKINKKKVVAQKIEELAKLEMQRLHNLNNKNQDNSLHLGSRLGSFIKGGVGLISAGLRGVANIVYDRDAKIKRQQKAKQMSSDIILEKIKYFETILRAHPDITENQMYRIAYFIGRQRGVYFKHFKDTQIIKGIEKFLSLTKSEGAEIDKNYKIFIFNLVYLNELTDNWAFKHYENLNPMISSNFMKNFQEFFDLNEKPLFEDSNCDCQTGEISSQVEKAKIKIHKTKKVQESTVERDTLSGADEAERKLHELAFIENLKILSSQIKDFLTYPINMQKICQNNFDVKMLRINFNKLQLANPAGSNNNDLEFNRELNIEIISSILKFEKGMMDALEIEKLKEKLESFTLHKIGGPMDVLMRHTFYMSSFNFRTNASHVKKLSEALLIAGNIASISPRQIKRKIWNVTLDNKSEKEIKTAKKLTKILYLHVKKAIVNFDHGVYVDNSSFIARFFDNYSLDNWVHEILKKSSEKFRDDLQKALGIKSVAKAPASEPQGENENTPSDNKHLVTESWNILYWHNMKAFQIEMEEIMNKFHESYYIRSVGSGSSSSYSAPAKEEEKGGFIEYLKEEMKKEVPIDDFRDYDEGINGGFTG